MTLTTRFVNAIKNKSLDLGVMIFFVSCFVLIKVEDSSRIYLSYALLISLVIILFLNKKRAKEIANYFINSEDEHVVSKIAGWSSFLAWCAFILFPFVINVHFSFMAKVLMALFSIFIIISSILTIFVLERNGHEKIKNIRLTLFSCLSLSYALSSALSASMFLQISNMDLSSSPWLEFCWKLTAFFILLFLILQIITYIILIASADKAKGYMIFTIFGALMLLSFLMIFAFSRMGVVANYVLNYATHSEWRDNVSCGNKIIKNPQEKYFGLNSDKYTVYFSGRSGKWGFDEITCIKDPQGNDGYTIKPVWAENIPLWAK